MTVSDSGYKKIAEQIYNVGPSKVKSNGKPVIVIGDQIWLTVIHTGGYDR